MLALASLNRWKAAALHLGISAVIAAVVVTAMLALWYPQPYFDAMGGTGLLKLLVGVDVAIGPLLTLIIFDQRKKSLKFDLTVIALLQAIALAYGVYVMFGARPVYTVFVVDRFEVVAAEQLDPSDLEEGAPEYRDLSFTGPRVIGTRLPDKANSAEWNTLILAGVAGKDVQNFPKYYVPYAQVKDQVLTKAKPLTQLAAGTSERAATVQAFVAKAQRPGTDLAYVPLVGRGQFMTAVIDRRDAQVLGILPIDPE